MAPAKTPEPIIRKMSEVLIKMADDPDAKETMRKARRQHGQDHARAIPRADPAGDGAVAAADQGNRGQEVIG